MKEEIKNLQFKIIKLRSKLNELKEKTHELFITYSYLEMQEKTEEMKKIIDNIGSEYKNTAEEYLVINNNINDLEQDLYSLIDQARDQGIQLEVVLNPGWIYVFTEEE